MNQKSPKADVFQVGVTLHSFAKEYLNYAWSFEDMLELAGYLGGGVEIVGPSHQRGFPVLTDEFERIFKSAVERFGLTPTSYGSYADPFRLADRNLTNDELIEYTIPQLKAAATLGFPVVRLQYFVHTVAEKLLPVAEKLNLRMGYELHAPLVFDADITKRLIDQIERLNSPHLGLVPDCGIFCHSIPKFRLDMAQRGLPEEVVQRAEKLWLSNVPIEEAQPQLLAMGISEAQFMALEMFWGCQGQSDPKHLVTYMHRIVHMHGKYFSIVNGDEPDVRYEEIVAALIKGGYRGWMSAEYEGSSDVNSFVSVKAYQDMVHRYIAKYV